MGAEVRVTELLFSSKPHPVNPHTHILLLGRNVWSMYIGRQHSPWFQGRAWCVRVSGQKTIMYFSVQNPRKELSLRGRWVPDGQVKCSVDPHCKPTHLSARSVCLHCWPAPLPIVCSPIYPIALPTFLAQSTTGLLNPLLPPSGPTHCHAHPATHPAWVSAHPILCSTPQGPPLSLNHLVL